jgi:8-oxo-dGTP pyrophosphatase MutT (NUDIX family)
MNDRRKSPGAGVVVLQNKGGKPHILGLRFRNRYDFPKGKKEEGESDLDCARRECWEEASISRLTFLPVDPVRLEDRLTLFLATTFQDAHIMPNPLTGYVEHEEVRWFPLDGAFDDFKEYLQVACQWTKDCIQLFDLDDMIEDEIR